VFLYSSNRMSLLVGNGLLTFIDRHTGFDTIFADDELPFYNDEDELVEKIRFYKNNDAERRKLAERGWRRIHQAFDTELVGQYIVDLSFGDKPSRDYAWPMA
jgi:glycosyltransferase involved in cell wall biosynthesis